MASTSTTRELIEAQISRYGRWTLHVSLSLATLAVLAVAIKAPSLVGYVPLALIMSLTLWWLFRRPLINLSVVLIAFALVAEFEEGLEVKEVIYAVYYVVFLFVWYFRQIFLYRTPLLRTTTDSLVVFILAWMTLYGALSFLYPGDARDVVNQLQAWSMLAFYFPVKEACSRDPRGVKVILFVVVVVGLFVVARNMVTLEQKISEATVAWQITRKGRVVTNEMLMMVPAFGVLAMTLVVNSIVKRTFLFGLFLVLLFGLIMTQGRGYWLAFAFGSVILLFLLRGPQRIQLVSMGLLGVAVCVLAILIAFGDNALLLAAGLWTRLLSIGSAASNDISLINRFLEWKSAFRDIMANPIMGYGMARKIQYFDITIEGTRRRAYIHNGYIGLWYHFGLAGLVSVVSLVLISIRNGFRITRTRTRDRFIWSAGTMAAASLTAMLVSTIASNAWIHADTILYLGITGGTAAGCIEQCLTRDGLEVR